MKKTQRDRMWELIRKVGVVRVKDLKAAGVPSVYVWRFTQQGLLERLGRGLYAMKGGTVTENHSLAEAAKRVPHGVVCLLSALRFHEMGTQLPREVWLAIGPKARSPKPNGLALRVARFSGKALTSGIEEHSIEGVNVNIYNPAKTVADCFKYRNKVGLDVALEALRDCQKKRKATMDDLWKYARICRVANVMRPYLESLT